MWSCVLLLLVGASAKLDSEVAEDETGESEERDRDIDNLSSERIGAAVTQITHHPYAASLIKNNSYICSAVILNTYWAISDSKCFDSDVISSYVTHRNLKNYTVRVGSSYNNKGGTLSKISMMINNFDLKVSAIKFTSPIEFNSRVDAVRLPRYDEEVQLGYLASIIAWTPIGHMRVVNAPLIEPSICELYTKLLPGHFICSGGVQDINRKYCRKDNGGAVIQNNTLVGISSFLYSCAIYSRAHAFPKVSSFARWLDSVIWDEDNRPTTTVSTVTDSTSKSVSIVNVTESSTQDDRNPLFGDPRKFMLTLPFDPINVPLEPAGDNSVIPRMSLYESYLQSKARAKTSTTSTTVDPKDAEDAKRNSMEMEWMKKYGNAVMMVPPQMYQNRPFDVNQYRRS